jgi:uncharacterized protein YkwD
MTGRRVASVCFLAVVLWLTVLQVPARASEAVDLMAQEINKARTARGLRPLRTSDSLSSSSSSYAGWLMLHDTLTHAQGIRASRRFPLVGEVLAYYRGWRLRVRGTVSRWLRSPTHRSALLSRSFTWLGAGRKRGRLGRSPSTIWVVQFGSG